MFEYDQFLPSLGEIRGVDQPVVTAADNDNVVVLPMPYDSVKDAH